MARIAAFVPNLMDRSRFSGDVVFVSDADELDTVDADLVIVDLDRCEHLADFVRPDTETIGFGPHVESELAEAARDAGYNQVLTRSVFFNRLVSLLR